MAVGYFQRYLLSYSIPDLLLSAAQVALCSLASCHEERNYYLASILSASVTTMGSACLRAMSLHSTLGSIKAKDRHDALDVRLTLQPHNCGQGHRHLLGRHTLSYYETTVGSISASGFHVQHLCMEKILAPTRSTINF